MRKRNRAKPVPWDAHTVRWPLKSSPVKSAIRKSAVCCWWSRRGSPGRACLLRVVPPYPPGDHPCAGRCLGHATDFSGISRSRAQESAFAKFPGDSESSRTIDNLEGVAEAGLMVGCCLIQLLKETARAKKSILTSQKQE